MSIRETTKFCIENIVGGWIKTVPNMAAIYVQSNPLSACFMAAFSFMAKVEAAREPQGFVPPDNLPPLKQGEVYEGGDGSRASGRIITVPTKPKPDEGRFDDVPMYNNITIPESPLTNICNTVEQIVGFFILRGTQIKHNGLSQKIIVYVSNEANIFIHHASMNFFKPPLENLLSECNNDFKNASSICNGIRGLLNAVDKAGWNYITNINSTTTILSEMGVIGDIFPMQPVNRTEYMAPITDISLQCVDIMGGTFYQG